MQAQEDSIINQSSLLLGAEPCRINPVIVPSRFELDDTRQMSDLKALGINCARAEEKRIRLRFLDRLAAPFEPSRAA